MTQSTSILKLSDDKPEAILKLYAEQNSVGLYRVYGDEIHDVYEKVFLAALTVDDQVLAKYCYSILNDKFYGSPRVKGLYGMFLEATSGEKDAFAYYDRQLKEDPNNVFIKKRRIALLRSCGRTDEFVKELVTYLDIYYNDLEAWAELADVYTETEDYSKAKYCYEEMLLLQPFEPRLFAALGDTLLAISSAQLRELYTALKHYCRAVELCDAFVHGWLGVKTCSDKILNLSRSEKKKLDYRLEKDNSSPLLDDKSVERLRALATKKLESLEDPLVKQQQQK
ncbi:TPR repeat protein Oca3/ER membrane protein complex Ecm2 [Schizosaccharomyces japonicus yFS275]|uniref:ER membrane protein complex subunit 2 n=1 Tax=Schizosaccharomyces japonicus (strain yFS275 / FY16936) TaxID=402676 RepID=B6JZM2_SCHJY|nr:TPR repeat protein Oca3/ER membrane protein complex Ecm2 [Schizosaccharomyces japonicus yFS275]EEB06990.1 TPR repeat protein Oca3/ER membrane protein complex Ecm2 [Schizosaccharomyces japonicus yFS275]